MKQNAKGLSNICILSTVVMVIATTTLALYVGQKEMLSFRFPMETKISVSDIADGQPTLPQLVHQTAEQYDVTISREADYKVTYISGVLQRQYRFCLSAGYIPAGYYLWCLSDNMGRL